MTAIEAEGREEYAVRYGDGEIEWDINDTREDVEKYLVAMRAAIKNGECDAADYEPMTIVTRRVFVIQTEWKEA